MGGIPLSSLCLWGGQHISFLQPRLAGKQITPSMASPRSCPAAYWTQEVNNPHGYHSENTLNFLDKCGEFSNWIGRRLGCCHPTSPPCPVGEHFAFFEKMQCSLNGILAEWATSCVCNAAGQLLLMEIPVVAVPTTGIFSLHRNPTGMVPSYLHCFRLDQCNNYNTRL